MIRSLRDPIKKKRPQRPYLKCFAINHGQSLVVKQKSQSLVVKQKSQSLVVKQKSQSLVVKQKSQSLVVKQTNVCWLLPSMYQAMENPL